MTLRSAALIAGFGLLVMAFLAGFAEFTLRQDVVVAGDAAATAGNIRAAEGLFRAVMAAYLGVAMLDVVLAWALYELLRPVNQSLSLLAAAFRLVYAAMLGGLLVPLAIVWQLVSGADYLAVFSAEQADALALVLLEAFDLGRNIGLAVFGLHLAVLGYLAFRADYIPRILGVLVAIDGLAHLFDSLALLLLDDYQPTVSQVAFIGEVLLLLWLLWKGFSGRDAVTAAAEE